MCIYPIGDTDACKYAVRLLAEHGLPLIDHPSPDVTHLLLDIPSFQKDGQLRCGGQLEPLLQMLPPETIIIGGQFQHSALADHRTFDLLTDPVYLAQNAAITADCALRLASQYMDRTFSHSNALVIGWGRIGKCLARLLRSAGTSVTVAVRKHSDFALLQALGYEALFVPDIPKHLSSFTLLFNTVPQTVVHTSIPDSCIAFELASLPGIPSESAIDARGLPGKMAPVTSGTLIANTIITYLKEDAL